MTYIHFNLIAASFVVSTLLCNGTEAAPLQFSQAFSQGTSSDHALGTNLVPPTEQLAQAKAAVELKPDDAPAHYNYGELLRKAGRYVEAACQYLDAVDLDPTMYVAFHQIAVMQCDPAQIDEALTYLSELNEDRPDELMLNVALSELLERKGEYYKAARILIDMNYTDKIPVKMRPRIKGRIHYLLAKVREGHGEDKKTSSTIQDEDTGILPPPLPEDLPQRILPAANTKDARSLEGTGHSTLLP